MDMFEPNLYNFQRLSLYKQQTGKDIDNKMPATDKARLSNTNVHVTRFPKNGLILPVLRRKSYKDILHFSDGNKRVKRSISLESTRKGSNEGDNANSSNKWITGGPIGSRDAVLVFNTSVLTSVNSLNSMPSSASTTPTNPPPLKTNSKYDLSSSPETQPINSIEGKTLCNKKIRLPKNIKFQLKRIARSASEQESLEHAPKKSNCESMMSSLSDQSLSSVTGDTTDIEVAILNSNYFGHDNDPHDSGEDDNDVNEVQHPEITNDTKESHSIGLSYLSQAGKHNSKQQLDDKENNMKKNQSIDKADMPASQLNIRYKFVQTETRLLRKILHEHGFKEVEDDQPFNLLWTGIHTKPDVLRNLAPYQRVNHFPRSYELTRKDRLYKNIEKMQHYRGFKYFDIIPQSFLLPSEYKDLVTAHNKYRGPWIVKPVASSRGRGIFIVNSPELIPLDESVLAAKYIADPLCIDGHKCDVRLYVAVLSMDPLIIYMYDEGLVRLATVKYDRNAENLWNPCMHLCNYSINKYHSDYIKSNRASDEDVGHKWTFSALLRHLKTQGCDIESLMLNIEDVIIKSIFACAQPIVSACRMFVPSGNNCFELYGFDILIDDTLKPWLLEVNLSPSLGIDTPLDAKVKSSMLVDLLNLVGIPAATPLMRASETRWNRGKSVSNRRNNSAELFISPTHKKIMSLTLEEMRIVKMARGQVSRRGGFVRIFPTEDSLQRYGMFLDNITGIPTSTLATVGSTACPMIVPHNYNLMLHSQLFIESAGTNSEIQQRMVQYERPIEFVEPLTIFTHHSPPKCSDEARRLRKQVKKSIENGNEMSPLQSRKAFGLYLESILKRLSLEPKQNHEKLILKFIHRAGINLKSPMFIKNNVNPKILSKDRSAMVAKQLGDYLTIYNRETEAFIDSFDRYGMIPIKLFNDFLSHAQECDLESVLTLHTNLTQIMPFLYNRCALNIPQTPPIPVGAHGFLKALPSMASGGASKDFAKIDNYYKLIDTTKPLKDINEKNDKMNGDKLEKPKKLAPIIANNSSNNNNNPNTYTNSNKKKKSVQSSIPR